jgi:uncharacterized protein (DUF4415 family)
MIKTRSGREFVLPSDEEDARITAAAEADPEARPFTDAEWEAALPTMRIGRPPGRPVLPAPRKTPVTLRLDVEVLAGLRALGKGWQTRVNGALQEWLKTHSA